MTTRHEKQLYALVFLVLLGCQARAMPLRPDIVIADFEGQDYGQWRATGTAFGTGPAQGTLPGQKLVSGYKGRRLASSYVGGDGATGTLTSPLFLIARRHINFLIGGGKHPGTTCLNLLGDGWMSARTAAAPRLSR